MWPFKRRRPGSGAAPENNAYPHAKQQVDSPNPAFIEVLPIRPGLIYPDLLREIVWGSNLRGILSKADWDRVLIPVRETSGMLSVNCRWCSGICVRSTVGTMSKSGSH
ncbi:hypothetical protein [Glycomyces buryatensis]|uniref:Uncharacterized protein n=1 Tax=Glycomyces buryatensis TaxID=2570927 RepID=A0A4S8QA90_9ACTN|nr:hypothetical protein [Glycomyces buryatensis]THV41180.1 hypothetical protein FAB82_13095 [Glycomyces buryatensis]